MLSTMIFEIGIYVGSLLNIILDCVSISLFRVLDRTREEAIDQPIDFALVLVYYLWKIKK